MSAAHTESVHAMWTEFSSLVLPKGCSVEQVKGMRLAFFTGVHAIIHSIYAKAKATPDSVPDHLLSLWKECEDFVKDYIADNPA